MRLIGDAFFDQRPDSFTRIQLRRVGWQTDQSDLLRYLQPSGPVRWRAVPDQNDALSFCRVRACELIEEELHAIGV